MHEFGSRREPARCRHPVRRVDGAHRRARSTSSSRPSRRRCCSSTVAIALLQVFCRYVLDNALSWPEEVAKFPFVWFVFLGAAMVTRRGRHIAIDMLPRSLARTRCASTRSRCG